MSNLNKVNIVKPIIKWVGGKTQIIDKIITNFPVTVSIILKIFICLVIKFHTHILLMPNKINKWSDFSFHYSTLFIT